MNNQQEVLASLLRTVLQIAGTSIATHGWVSAGNWEIISGAILTLGTTAYTVYTRWNTVKVDVPALAK